MEIWYLHYFEYAELNGRVHYIWLNLEIHFLVQKNEIVSLSWNLVQSIIEICGLRWRFLLILLLSFDAGNLLFVQKIFGPKNQNCLFKLKFSTFTNSNLQNSMEISTFCFRLKIPFWGKFDQKIQNCVLKVKFDT